MDYKDLITINLLGGAKKAVGSPLLVYEKPTASIAEIVSFLQHNARTSHDSLKLDNILVVVNGVESSALPGNKMLVEQGDIVTIVPIVHGG
jgi:hypothetical protein